MNEKVDFLNKDIVTEKLNNYNNYLYAIIYSYMKNHEDSEDRLQEVKLKVYENYNESIENFKSWSARIAVNICINYLKTKKKEEYSIDEYGIPLPSNTNIEEEYIIEEDRKKIRNILNELPEKYRTILYEFYFTELSYEEIAKKHNLNKRTVETRIYRGRLKFKERWEKYAL